jgi:hypothetical protein
MSNLSLEVIGKSGMHCGQTLEPDPATTNPEGIAFQTA